MWQSVVLRLLLPVRWWCWLSSEWPAGQRCAARPFECVEKKVRLKKGFLSCVLLCSNRTEHVFVSSDTFPPLFSLLTDDL